MRLHILAFDDLSKGALSKNIQDKVPGWTLVQICHAYMEHALVTVVSSQPIVDIEDIVVIVIVVPVVVCGLAWLGQHAPGVMRRLVSEGWVTNVEGLDNVRSQLPDRLRK